MSDINPTIVFIGGKWCLVDVVNDDTEITPLNPERAYPVKRKTLNTRTVQTNAALHKYFSLVAESLNSSGFTIQKVVALFRKAGIEWSMMSVKSVIWRNIQYALTEKESTTQLTQEEVTRVYKNVDHYLSGTVGIEHIAFPSIENMLLEKQIKEAE